MGSRKISFDPAASTPGDDGFRVMNVSLCGPHSFETSTLEPTVSEAVLAGAASAACWDRYWYFAHQTGEGELFCAQPHVAADKIAKRKLCRTGMCPLLAPNKVTRAGLSRSRAVKQVFEADAEAGDEDGAEVVVFVENALGALAKQEAPPGANHQQPSFRPPPAI